MLHMLGKLFFPLAILLVISFIHIPNEVLAQVISDSDNCGEISVITPNSLLERGSLVSADDRVWQDRSGDINTLTGTLIFEQAVGSMFYSYNKDSSEVFNVYVRVHDNIYAWFRIVHEVNHDLNKNLWRVRDSYMCSYQDNEMKSLYQILTGGENEFVWFSARPNVYEATGGYHGNERIDYDLYGNVRFFADGHPIDLSQPVRLKPCESFHYIQRSTIHETGTGASIRSKSYVPVEGNPIECYHEKKTVFGNGGYDTYNQLIWAKNNTPVKTNAFGLFCVTNEVAKIGYDVTGNKVVFNSDGESKLLSSNSKIVLQNPELNISVTCDSKFIQPIDDEYTTSSRIWDTKIYRKYYHRLKGNAGQIYQTVEGEVWRSQASIHFNKIE